MKKNLFIIIATIAFAGCSKKTASVGHVQFVNDFTDVYQAYIDGKPQDVIEAYSSHIFDVSVGKHDLKAQQISGSGNVSFTLQPDVAADQTILFMFPH